MTEYYLAIDIGASSGRHILGSVDNGELKTTEVFRFENGAQQQDGRAVWDIDKLFEQVKAGIKQAFAQCKTIKSLAIDTWGVDYVLMKDDCPVYPCYSYRDSRGAMRTDEVHRIVPFAKLYAVTGVQYMSYNTVYQLQDDKVRGRLNDVTDFLMIPEYLNWRLTGKKCKEYTNGTTTGLVNAATGEFDAELIAAFGFPSKLFGSLSAPSTALGPLLPEVADEVGGNCTVKLCASHDTASAFESVVLPEKAVLISSGTWSLVGVKLKNAVTDSASLAANFTNEGGVGYFRYLKNVTGMWINVRLSKEFGTDYPLMQKLAEQSTFEGVFDVDDKDFANPSDMSGAIRDWFIKRGVTPPVTQGDYVRSAYLSLAAAYSRVITEMEKITGENYESIYILGGGAKNAVVNRFTEAATGKKVVATPIEATAIGNIIVQSRS